MHLAAIISSIIILIGCFLPWIDLGFVQRSGIDNPDGVIVLVGAIISGSTGLYNFNKKLNLNTWIYTVVGILIVLLFLFDFSEISERAESLTNNLNKAFNADNDLAASDIMGSGLYAVLLGSIGLFLSGIGVFGKNNEDNQPIENEAIEAEIEIYDPKVKLEIYAEKEIQNEPIIDENQRYKNKLIKLNRDIKIEINSIMSTDRRKVILHNIDLLCPDKNSALHLIN
ncbi:MAG: hypothetical protein ACXWEY_07055, partial [Bacteroidia bacterium]